MAMQYVEKSKELDKLDKLEATTMPSTVSTTPAPEPKTWTTTTKTTTTTTENPTTTTFRPTAKRKIISDVPKIINSVKTFTRYYIPPEVKISHAVGSTDY